MEDFPVLNIATYPQLQQQNVGKKELHLNQASKSILARKLFFNRMSDPLR